MFKFLEVGCVGRKNSSNDRINQIVDAVINSIKDNGYENLTIQSISKYSGLSKGAINHYFKSKQDILISVLESIDKKLFEIVDRKVKSSPDSGDQLRFRLSGTFEVIKSDPALIYVILSLGISNPIYAENIKKFFSKFRKLTSAGVNPGLEKGEYKGIQPEPIGALLFGLAIGMGIQWVLDEGSFDFDEAARISEDMVICYLEEKSKNS